MFSFLVNLIFPKTCYFCNKEGNYLCNQCIRIYMKFNWEQRCYVCGKVCSKGFVHEECKQWGYLDGLLYITIYDKKFREIIKDVKYNFHFDVLNELGEIMSQYLKTYHFSLDMVLTDVPLHSRKYKFRGFNQSEVLAKFVSKRSKFKYKKLLKRKEDTITQVGLSKEERENNLREAFETLEKVQLPLRQLSNGGEVMIIDDVFTTGATLNQCAKVLKDSGVEKVYGFVFAKSRE